MAPRSISGALTLVLVLLGGCSEQGGGSGGAAGAAGAGGTGGGAGLAGGGRGGGGGGGGVACEILGPLEPEYLEERRKVVIVETRYVDGYAELEAMQITIRYGIGPRLVNELPTGYRVFVEDAAGSEILAYSHEHPAMELGEGPPGCTWIPPEDMVLHESFDFVEPRAATVRIVDVEGEVVCGGQSYVGSSAELLRADLGPCLDRFCEAAAAPGDPACP